jgi:Protein of unknown function (DUF1064)
MSRAADGFANWTLADIEAHNANVGKRGQKPALPAPSDEPAAKQSKYRNVRTVVDGITFDSKREAQHWAELKMRERAGEIECLERQFSFDLECPSAGDVAPGTCSVVARYIADFRYFDIREQRWRVVDAKGKRTAMYQLKKKWLELQSGIVIEEV